MIALMRAMNPWLIGFFAFATIHYVVQWCLSRSERVLLTFAIQCALYTVFCSMTVALAHAATIPEARTRYTVLMMLGPAVHVVLLQFYAFLSGRRDRAFRVVLTSAFVALGVSNVWFPLRGALIGLTSTTLAGGTVIHVPLLTGPGAPLGLYYLASVVAEGYGFVVARALWRRDRSGAILVALSACVIMVGTANSTLVDFANLPMPYLGALPHTLFVLFMALFLAREYSARGERASAVARQLDVVFEHSPVGKALVAVDGRILRVNRAFCVLVGEPAEEICSRRLDDLFADDDRESVAAGNVEKRLVRKKGDPAWVLLNVSSVPDDRGRVRKIAQIQDVTEVRAYRQGLEQLVATRTRELHEAKDAAERANHAKGLFLAQMSHEIRNPLHIMLLNAGLLEHDGSLDAEQRNSAATIQRNGKHLKAIVSDVLDMSKIEAGRMKVAEAPFDVGAVLDEVAQMFAARTANGVELSIQRTSELPRVIGDGGKVKQIVINLVSNAIKFTQRGSIRIIQTSSAVADTDAVLIEIVVVDTGIGIAERDRTRLFKPFEQLEAGAKAGGTGLGLAISHALARLIGGDLTVESTLGAGTQFKLTFEASAIE
jgi:PAS domain S-box-containing protein